MEQRVTDFFRDLENEFLDDDDWLLMTQELFQRDELDPDDLELAEDEAEDWVSLPEAA